MSKEIEKIVPVGQPRIVRRLCVSHHFACDCREARFAALLMDTLLSHSTPDNGAYNECDTAPCEWCREARDLIEFGLPSKIEQQPEIRYTGHPYCNKCGTSHWMYGSCPTTSSSGIAAESEL